MVYRVLTAEVSWRGMKRWVVQSFFGMGWTRGIVFEDAFQARAHHDNMVQIAATPPFMSNMENEDE